MRKTRENIVLRGIRGDICQYLDELVARCLDTATKVIRSGRLGALVVMGFCNWGVMASHHKLRELVTQVREVKRYPMCVYQSTMNTTQHDKLLEALEPYGTLGGVDGPGVVKSRVEMDLLYHEKRQSAKTHLAWVADSTRSLLNPPTLRRIVDIVHFEWSGDVGDVEYCP